MVISKAHCVGLVSESLQLGLDSRNVRTKDPRILDGTVLAHVQYVNVFALTKYSDTPSWDEMSTPPLPHCV